MDYNIPMQTVAELPEYIRAANKLLSETERQDIVRYLAEHPKEGDLMEGTGGVRKLRWQRGGKGKSGGVASSIIFMMGRYLSTCLPCSPKALALT
jgi:hypothetical protein